MNTKAVKSVQKVLALMGRVDGNCQIAYSHARRLAFEMLVFVESAGPGGGSPTDSYGEQVLQQETDSAIDYLQSLIDQQQAALEGLGNSGDGRSGPSADDQPCQTYLSLYQAAIKINDPKAKTYLSQYSNCLERQSDSKSPLKKQSSS